MTVKGHIIGIRLRERKGSVDFSLTHTHTQIQTAQWSQTLTKEKRNEDNSEYNNSD